MRQEGDSTRELLDYNASNLPRGVVLDGERTVTLDYDADGERVAKHDGDDHTYYFGDSYTRKVIASGAVEHTYIVDLGTRSTYRETRVDAILPQVTRTYTINDRLGSASLVTDSEGKKLSSQSFGVFGESDASLVSDKPGYTGHLHDTELGLVNMKGRLYDPASGRFTTPDPFVFRPWGAGLNRYSYVENNPLRYIDPTGYQSCSDFEDVESCEEIDIDDGSVVEGGGPEPSQPEQPQPGAPGTTGDEVMGGNPVPASVPTPDEQRALDLSIKVAVDEVVVDAAGTAHRECA